MHAAPLNQLQIFPNGPIELIFLDMLKCCWLVKCWDIVAQVRFTTGSKLCCVPNDQQTYVGS